MSSAKQLTDAEVKAAEEAFDHFDRRNQGQIKTGEITDAMKKLGHNIKPSFIEKMSDQIDEDGTGYIDFNEFQKIIMQKKQDDEDEKELREAFRVLDTEKRGEINVDKLRWILKNLGDDLTEDEIDDMIADTDTDASGYVDFDEFSKLMMSG